MTTTPKFQLPYPAQVDIANVPVDLKKLCDRLEVVLGQVGATGDLVWSVLASRPGAVPCDGALYDSVADTSFAALYAAIGTTYGGTGASSFAVPDVRGRLLVCRGSHADVNAAGKNDNLAVASRTPRHGHTSALSFTGSAGNTGTESADHAHSGQTGGVSANHYHGVTASYVSGGDWQWSDYNGVNHFQNNVGNTGWISSDHSHAFSTGGRNAAHSHAFTPAGTIGGTIGGQGGAVDLPSYIVENCFIVK